MSPGSCVPGVPPSARVASLARRAYSSAFLPQHQKARKRVVPDNFIKSYSPSRGRRTTEYPANGSFNRITSRSGFVACIGKTIYGQASRLISIGKLNMSPCLHTRPITWSSSRSLQGSKLPGRSHLVEGFTLRCIQRFSLPDVATRRCRWRDNRYTRGPSNPVLSY